MAGIYIHIPFCRRKCHYCNFFSVASTRYRAKLLEALQEELYTRKNYLEGEPVSSVYLGGGTPSLLDPVDIKGLLDLIRGQYETVHDAEITIEVNPDDANPGLYAAFLEMGINRVSIGVQSFFDADLEYLNRIHMADRAEKAVREALAAGFRNISIDLIYGIPGMDEQKWEANLDRFFELELPHLSAYSLTVEPKTALDVMIRQGKVPAPSEEDMIRQFSILMDRMRKNGYDHYEISNFSKKGYYSLHNSMYWNGGHYLGAGPSAHSYDGASRRWNVASIVEYIDQIGRHENYFETEILTPVQKYNEYIMVSFRTQWGCDSGKIRAEFGTENEQYFLERVRKYVDSGDVNKEGTNYYLSDNGKLFADSIASDLFAESAVD